MINKQKVIDWAIQVLRNEILKIQSIRDSEHDALKDSPSAMQSWSDTTRSQKEDIVFEMDQQLTNKKRTLHVLESLKVEHHKKIQLGSLVKLTADKQTSYFFILPGIIGDKFDVDGINIEIISPTSIVARSLMGHKINDVVHVKIPTGISVLHVDDIE